MNEFQEKLSAEQKAAFNSTAKDVPTTEAVTLLTSEISDKTASRKSHVLASRMRPVLEAMQQYSAIGDAASSVHPMAILVWSSVKFVVQVRSSFVVEIFSNFNRISAFFEFCQIF